MTRQHHGMLSNSCKGMQVFDAHKKYRCFLHLLTRVAFTVCCGPPRKSCAYFPSECFVCMYVCVCAPVFVCVGLKLKTTTHYFNLIDSACIKSKTKKFTTLEWHSTKKKK